MTSPGLPPSSGPWFCSPDRPVSGDAIYEPVRVDPRDVPGIRDEIANWGWAAAAAAAPADEPDGERMFGYYRDKVSRTQFPSLFAAAELFHVDETFAGLVSAAHDTMPHHSLTELDPPTPVGLVMNQLPVAVPLARHFGDVAGWFWAATADSLIAGFLWDKRVTRGRPWRREYGRYAPILYKFAWGESFDSRPWQEQGLALDNIRDFTRRSHRLYVSNLVVFWNLLRQKSVAEESIATLPRPARRRMQRAGLTPPRIRVISLPGNRSGTAAGESEREWRHRWVVRGHWRQQWYPSLKDHRPVWIAPHLKGPEDAPLLGGQKVYAVKVPAQADAEVSS